MKYELSVKKILDQIIKISRQENKPSGFCIGNTTKKDVSDLYFTPVRDTSLMVLGGVIIYQEHLAVNIAKMIDDVVDYVLVDAEKKTPCDQSSAVENIANVERSVRETIKKSKIWVYKGNDLAVEAVDGFLTHLTQNSIRGIGGKKVAILGAGNLGSKLALKLVERGAQVYITRRNKEKVKLIAEALNSIKPPYTVAQVFGGVDNEEAAYGADIIIGLTQGIPVITASMIKNIAADALILDGGKGCLYPEAISMADKLNMTIYRIDIAAALDGKISSLFAIEDIVEKKLGRRQLSNGRVMVSGGLLGRKGEIIVDSINNPKIIYGIADGKGDFLRNSSKDQLIAIEKLIKAESANSE